MNQVSRSIRKTAWLLFVFSGLIYISTTAGHLYSFDEEVMFQTTRSIVLYHKVSIPDTKYHRLYGMRGTDGKLYSKFGLGQSISAIPLFVVSRIIGKILYPGGSPYITNLEYFFTSLTCIWITALSVSVFFLLLCKLGFSSRTSLTGTLFYAFTTMVWPYSKFFFAEPFCLLTLLLSFYFVCGDEKKDSDYIFSGLFLGLSFMGRIEIITLVPLFYWFLFPLKNINKFFRENRKNILRFTTPLLLIVLIITAYNLIRFGVFYQTGVVGSDKSDRFDTPLLVGLYGMLFSPGKSIFLYSPFFLLFFTGLARAWRKNTRLITFSCLIILFTLLLHAKWHSWTGGWSWGPRRLLVIHPFLGLISVFGLDELINNVKKKYGYIVLYLIFMAGIIVQFIGVSVNFMSYIKSVPVFDWTNYYPAYAPLFGYIPYIRRTGDIDLKAGFFVVFPIIIFLIFIFKKILETRREDKNIN